MVTETETVAEREKETETGIESGTATESENGITAGVRVQVVIAAEAAIVNEIVTDTMAEKETGTGNVNANEISKITTETGQSSYFLSQF